MTLLVKLFQGWLYNRYYGSHIYIPDFLVETKEGIFLEEVKGWVREKETFKLKCEAAEKYCKENNMVFRVVYKDELGNA